MRWFRFYDDAINDPKILKLSDESFRAWVGILCVASKTKGVLPSTADLGFYLRMKPTRVAALIAQLVSAGLLDKEGESYVPHNWSGRQYLSDGSASRVKRHREKRESLGLVGQWTAPKALRMAVYERDGHKCVYCEETENLSLDHKTPEFRGGSNDIENLQTLCRACNGAKRDMTHEEYVTRNDLVTLLKRPQNTEAEYRTETKKKDSSPSAVDLAFDEFWRDYPKRDGSNPKEPAAKLFRAAVKSGTPASEIIAGVRNCAVAEAKNIGTPYIPQAVKWLRDRRWKDYQTVSAVQASPEVDWDAVLTAYKRMGIWSKYAGPDLDSPACRVPHEMLAKHGLLRADEINPLNVPRLKSMGGLN